MGGKLAGCANNCPGVDPAAIIVGGGGLVTAAAFGGVSAINTILPLLGAAGAGVVLLSTKLRKVTKVTDSVRRNLFPIFWSS